MRTSIDLAFWRISGAGVEINLGQYVLAFQAEKVSEMRHKKDTAQLHIQTIGDTLMMMTLYGSEPDPKPDTDCIHQEKLRNNFNFQMDDRTGSMQSLERDVIAAMMMIRTEVHPIEYRIPYHTPLPPMNVAHAVYSTLKHKWSNQKNHYYSYCAPYKRHVVQDAMVTLNGMIDESVAQIERLMKTGLTSDCKGLLREMRDTIVEETKGDLRGVIMNCQPTDDDLATVETIRHAIERDGSEYVRHLNVHWIFFVKRMKTVCIFRFTIIEEIGEQGGLAEVFRDYSDTWILG